MTTTQKGRELAVVAIGDGQMALVTDAPLSEAATFRRDQGGDALLTAVSAARCGVHAALVTRVGTDACSEALLESWDEEGLHLDYANQVAGRNGMTLIGSDGVVAFREGAAAHLEPKDVAMVPWGLTQFAFAPGSTLALGPHPARTVKVAFQGARSHGATTVFDPSLHPGLWPEGNPNAAKAAFDELLPLVDLLIISGPFATAQLLRRASAVEAAEEAQRRGVSRVIVRHGRQHCLVVDRDRSRELSLESPTGALVSAAGEAHFNGVLMAKLAHGESLDEAARHALAAIADLPNEPRTLSDLG